MANCPRCRNDNDAEALQCATCGEMLVKVRSGTNWAADLREANARIQPFAIAAPVLEVFRARSVFRGVKLCGWLALLAAIAAGILAGLAFIFTEQGYYLFEAAVVIGCTVPAIVAVGLLILLFGYILQALSTWFANIEVRYKQKHPSAPSSTQGERTLKPPQRKDAAGPEPIPATPTPSPAVPSLPSSIRLLSRYGNPALSGCAFLCFIFLPQYQLGDNVTGYQCIQMIAVGLLQLRREFANTESLVALAIPLALAIQFQLALQRHRTALLASSLTSIGLLLTFFLINFAKHTDTAFQQVLKQTETTISFRHGYLIVFFIVIASALLAGLKLIASTHTKRVEEYRDIPKRKA